MSPGKTDADARAIGSGHGLASEPLPFAEAVGDAYQFAACDATTNTNMVSHCFTAFPSGLSNTLEGLRSE